MLVPTSSSLLLIPTLITTTFAKIDNDVSNFRRSPITPGSKRFERRQNTQNSFTSLSLTASNSQAPWNGQSINAVLDRFMIGIETKSSCSLPANRQNECPAGDSTVIRIYPDQKAQMAVMVPGSQNILLALNPQVPTQHGNLSYTAAHLQPNNVPNTPEGWPADTGFMFTPDSNATATTTGTGSGPTAVMTRTSTALFPTGTGTAPSSQYAVGTTGTVTYQNIPNWLACPAVWFDAVESDAMGKAWNVLAVTEAITFDWQSLGCLEFKMLGTVVSSQAAAYQYARVQKKRRSEKARG